MNAYFTSTLLFQVLATGTLHQELARELVQFISVAMSTTDEKLDELKEVFAGSALREGQEDN